jgi:hypothetical protein
VPIDSPVARLARLIGADPTGELSRKVGDLLRANVTACPCTPCDECPALSESRLIEGMERAAALSPNDRPRGSRRPRNSR